MARPRRPKLAQYIPEQPQVMFQVVEYQKGESYWQVTISDFQSEDRPVFRCKLGKWVPRQVAVAGAEECQEARGLVTVERWEHGIPTLTQVWGSNGRNVFLLRGAEA